MKITPEQRALVRADIELRIDLHSQANANSPIGAATIKRYKMLLAIIDEHALLTEVADAVIDDCDSFSLRVADALEALGKSRA